MITNKDLNKQRTQDMKNLADFKRALTLGSKWHCYNHLGGGCELGIGEVVIKQTNSVAFKREGNERPSYVHFPKADCIKFEDDKVHIYWPDGTHVLTYRQV